jgi:hypothetical protein
MLASPLARLAGPAGDVVPEAHVLCALLEALHLPETSDKVFSVKLSTNDVNS